MPSTPIADSADRSLGERLWRTALTTVADHLEPVMNLYKPYVEGVEHLPADGRFLIVGNHTQMSAAEIVLIPYCVRQAIGSQVRPLADRQFGKMRGLQADLIAAYGAVVGSPEAAATLMQENATILVFPGGGREIGKFRGEEYKLRWDNRYGFARLAAEHRYPIVTAALVGGDDVYTSITTRDSLYGRASSWLGQRLGGRSDMAMPLVRGIGPTLIPQPQRMYLRFGAPISSAEPAGTPPDTWVTELKEKVQEQLEFDLQDLQRVRRNDPYRALNPLARHLAATPPA